MIEIQNLEIQKLEGLLENSRGTGSEASALGNCRQSLKVRTVSKSLNFPKISVLSDSAETSL